MSNETTIKDVPIEALEPNPYQPRQHFGEQAHEELVESIREHGILQPLLVRPAPNGSAEYQIVAGERRYRASAAVGLEAVPATVRDLSDEEAAKLALLENVERDDLSPIEEAQSLSGLLEWYETQEALAEEVGYSPGYISQRMSLLDLPGRVRQLVNEGKLTSTHARELLEVVPLGKDLVGDLAESIVEEEVPTRILDRHTRRFLVEDPRVMPLESVDFDHEILFDPDDVRAFEDEHRHEVADYEWITNADRSDQVQRWHRRQANAVREAIKADELVSFRIERAFKMLESGQFDGELEQEWQKTRQLYEDYMSSDDDESVGQSERTVAERVADCRTKIKGNYVDHFAEVLADRVNVGEVGITLWERLVAALDSTHFTKPLYEELLAGAIGWEPEDNDRGYNKFSIMNQNNHGEDPEAVFETLTQWAEEHYDPEQLLNRVLTFRGPALGLSSRNDSVRALFTMSLDAADLRSIHEAALEATRGDWTEYLEAKELEPGQEDVPDVAETDHAPAEHPEDHETIRDYVLEHL